MLRQLGVQTGLHGISPGVGLLRHLGVQASLHDILSEARVGRLIAPAGIGEMSLAVDFVSLVSGRAVADSAEILIGRLVMDG
jgi:hypothetical protein